MRSARPVEDHVDREKIHPTLFQRIPTSSRDTGRPLGFEPQDYLRRPGVGSRGKAEARGDLLADRYRSNVISCAARVGAEARPRRNRKLLGDSFLWKESLADRRCSSRIGVSFRVRDIDGYGSSSAAGRFPRPSSFRLGLRRCRRYPDRQEEPPERLHSETGSFPAEGVDVPHAWSVGPGRVGQTCCVDIGVTS